MLIERRVKRKKRNKPYRKHLNYNVLKKNPKLFQKAISTFRMKYKPRTKALAPVVNLIHPCAQWKGYHDKDGYAKLNISDINVENGQEYSCNVSHFIHYMIHRREIKKGHLIAHLCQSPWCVEPTHLLETKQKQNLAHARLNRQNIPLSNESWKLSTPEVESILYLYYVLHYDISWIHEQFSHVSRTSVYNAIKGITYEVVSINHLTKKRRKS